MMRHCSCCCLVYLVLKIGLGTAAGLGAAERARAATTASGCAQAGSRVGRACAGSSRGLDRRGPGRDDRGGRAGRRGEGSRGCPHHRVARTTVLPGLIDAHTHVLLHPYNEAVWDDQVLKEALALRVCRATNHLRSTLLSGFTTIRDLGTEGAGYADVGLKQAVAQGIVPGPRMLVVTRAIVATGSYAPKGFAPEFDIPQGAEEADGVDSLIRVVRDQIGKGADWIKVYADTAMGGAAIRPSFSLEELTRIVETARSVGILVSAHATSKEGMRRAALAGVATIEHGDGGDLEVFKLMAERGVVLCPTLAAFEASARYRGYRPGTDPEPARLKRARATFKRHSRRASRSPTAATWVCSPTATARASSSCWSTTV